MWCMSYGTVSGLLFTVEVPSGPPGMGGVGGPGVCGGNIFDVGFPPCGITVRRGAFVPIKVPVVVIG